jgi:RNA polymerase sigma factor (sigma-70 family)
LTRVRDRRTRERLLRERAAGATATAAPGSERLALVRQWLARLPEPLAEVAVYSYVDGMTQQEIAEQIGGSRRRVGDLLRQLEELSPAGPPAGERKEGP